MCCCRTLQFWVPCPYNPTPCFALRTLQVGEIIDAATAADAPPAPAEPKGGGGPSLKVRVVWAARHGSLGCLLGTNFQPTDVLPCHLPCLRALTQAADGAPAAALHSARCAGCSSSLALSCTRRCSSLSFVCLMHLQHALACSPNPRWQAGRPNAHLFPTLPSHLFARCPAWFADPDPGGGQRGAGRRSRGRDGRSCH